jgi:hypothetical protein
MYLLICDWNKTHKHFKPFARKRQPFIHNKSSIAIHFSIFIIHCKISIDVVYGLTWSYPFQLKCFSLGCFLYEWLFQCHFKNLSKIGFCKKIDHLDTIYLLILPFMTQQVPVSNWRINLLKKIQK